MAVPPLGWEVYNSAPFRIRIVNAVTGTGNPVYCIQVLKRPLPGLHRAEIFGRYNKFNESGSEMSEMNDSFELMAFWILKNAEKQNRRDREVRK
jgi:hypothetical protein